MKALIFCIISALLLPLMLIVSSVLPPSGLTSAFHGSLLYFIPLALMLNFAAAAISLYHVIYGKQRAAFSITLCLTALPVVGFFFLLIQ